MKSAKNLFLGAFVFGAIALFSACGNVNDFAVIEECRNIQSTPDCRACCIANGWETGSYLLTEGNCECRNLD